MIDEDRTMQLYGYTSNELKQHSDKLIVAVCEECGMYRDLKMRGYHDLCRSCSAKKRCEDPEFRKRLSEANIGENNPNFGLKRSQSTKDKISFAVSGEKNGMFGVQIIGEHHWNWKGGITTRNNAFYCSAAYKNWRKAVYERDNYTCQKCGDDSGGNLQSHHIIPIRDHRDDLLAIDINNGITLCKKCHREVTWDEYEYVEMFKDILTG